MADELFSNGEVKLAIRTKLNSMAGYFQIAVTDEAISAGTITSVPISTLTKDLLASGAKVYLVEYATGVTYELTLGADLLTAATAMTVSSIAVDAIASGSPIFYKYEDVLTRIYALEHST